MKCITQTEWKSGSEAYRLNHFSPARDYDMSKYKQLTYEQRCQIEVLNKSSFSQTEIAEAIGVSQSCISRELKRNRGERGYRHKQAQLKAEKRRRQIDKQHKMTPEMIDLIEDKIYKKWSPEQISGRLKAEENIHISHESIYQHIWEDKRLGGDLYSFLRRTGRKYQSRGKNGKTTRGQIKNRVSIDERPDIVDKKEEVGHWEIDTVIGKNHSGCLVTIVERVTKFTVSARLDSKHSDEVTAAAVTLLAPFKKVVNSITADNGKEFAQHEKISAQLECDVYFAHPYHSWERGLNENTNGLLRQYFPKSTDFKEVCDNEVECTVACLNNRPRKSLDFKSPAAVMDQHMAALAA